MQECTPYAPAGEASGETSYELVPSMVTQAPAALSPMDAIATTPIPRAHSSEVVTMDKHGRSRNGIRTGHSPAMD